MPTFDTPEPLSATVEVEIGTLRIIAGKRTDTVVDVQPGDPTADLDVRAVQQTKVTCSGGKLVVKGPKTRNLFAKKGPHLDVTIELPAGSDVDVNSPMADVTCEGPLGECTLKTSAGDLQVETATTVYLKTGFGDIRLDHASGDAEILGMGRIDVGEIAGPATVKNGNGDITIGEITGELRTKAANGRISVGVAHAGVDAKSANGGIRVGEVVRGRVTLQTAAGDLEVGIRESTAAWLEVNTSFGKVQNSLDAAEGPGNSGEMVEVRARTSMGDIVIRRA